MFTRLGHDKVASRTAAQLFAAYRTKTARGGFLYARQERDAVEGSTAPDLSLDIYSGFGVIDLKPQKFSVFGRVDRYDDPCPDCASIDYLPIDTSTKFTLVVAGAEYYLDPVRPVQPERGMGPLQRPGRLRDRDAERRHRLARDVLLGLVAAGCRSRSCRRGRRHTLE